MRAHTILCLTRKRLASPRTWGLLVILSLVWSLLSVAIGVGFPSIRVAISPIYWGVAVLIVFPMPWQWSGDDRALPSFWRGLVQAIVWDLLWISLIICLARAIPFGHASLHPSSVASHEHKQIPFVLGFLILSIGLLAGWLVATKERAEDAAIQARMNVLQSQMNPHVLFNIISGLCEMARMQPWLMEQALLNLADFLRELLDYSAKLQAPLSWERSMVERYLSLEQIRLGKRLQVIWDWDSALEHLEFPPLMLQPLVENAIKHGIAPDLEGGIVRIRLAGNMAHLELEVANTGVGLADAWGDGLGLRNERERLAFHDSSAEFKLYQDGEWTRASIRSRRCS